MSANNKEFIINKDLKFWKDKLTPDQYNVLVEKGTEAACLNQYYNNDRKGLYVCAACNNILFSSGEKYKSGSGWPSFYDAVDEKAVGTRDDTSYGMIRTELYCSRCGGHLGHIFNDGPEPTGLRYCINSDALYFLQEAEFAMGCFWEPDALFGGVDGVYFVKVGYAGGEMKNPTYHNLGKHAETVQILYNPDVVTFQDLLDVFWQHHNPTISPYSDQYRSIIFYNDQDQKEIAEGFIKTKKKKSLKKIYTELKEMHNFTAAEDYHQKYLLKRNKELYNRVKTLYTDEEEFVQSQLAARLSAFNSGFLSKEEMVKYLRNHYKYVNYSQQIEDIITELEARPEVSCGI